MNKFFQVVLWIMQAAMSLCLAAMAILVFGNVVLRYLFHSGITWSEEMSRYLFVYLVFIGAIVAMQKNEHLGVDMLVKRFPSRWKKVAYVLSNVIILAVLFITADGARKVVMINTHNHAPATGIPLWIVYSIALLSVIGMSIFVLRNLYLVLFSKLPIEQIFVIHESEEGHPPELEGGKKP